MERTKSSKQYVPGFLNNANVLNASAASNGEEALIDALGHETNKKGRDLLHLNCRFYERRYPEVDELVIVNVLSIAEMGAYVSLLEYNNIEGMILLSELSRRRIRSVNKLIRVGKTEVVTVLRVDKEKGYIDLSKSRVSSEDILKCEERYNKAKTVHAVLRQLALQTGESLEHYYELIGWPLYKKIPLETQAETGEKKTEYMHCYDIFKSGLTDRNVFNDLKISEELKEALIDIIKRKLTPQPMKIRTDIEVTCFTYEGIDAIREALIAAENIGDEEVPIKVKLIAPPMYVMTTSTIAKSKGLEKLTEATAIIKTKIEEKGGNLKVKMEPKIVSQNEEKELLMMLDRLEMENRLIDGDDDEEGEEDERDNEP